MVVSNSFSRYASSCIPVTHVL